VERREFIATATGLSLGATRTTSADSAAAATQTPVKPASRAEAIAIIANARKIMTPNGVERLETVRIGGIDQWVSVRGVDRRDPYCCTFMAESERRGWRFAIDAARREANGQAIHDLESIAPYSPPGRLIPLNDIYTQRRWVEFYGGTMAYRHGNDAEGALANLSPDYSDAEIQRIWEGNVFGERYLLSGALGLDLSQVLTLGCPLVIFAGRHDMVVNSDLASDWFSAVAAPSKHLIWFEHSAHLPMTEERGKYLLSLIRYARPLAEQVGDGAP
jgi:pimeloyl-ACP methyl ester carboxylesterase